MTEIEADLAKRTTEEMMQDEAVEAEEERIEAEESAKEAKCLKEKCLTCINKCTWYEQKQNRCDKNH